jgi:fluoroquinolone transport system permease protein
LQVTPLSLNAYAAYRLGVPMVLTLALMFITIPLADLGRSDSALVAITAVSVAPVAPIFALLLVSFPKNKVQAFAAGKLAGNVLLVVPLFAFFVDSGWELAFGILPTYWPLKVYWTLEAGTGSVWVYAVAGILYQAAVIALLVRRFGRVMHR